MSVVLSALSPDTEGGPAAASGSATHYTVEVFHRELGDPITRQEAAVAAVSQAVAKFPGADREKVLRWTRAYTADPKNIAADVEYAEKSVTLHRRGVVFKGTLDQVRRTRLKPWHPVDEMLDEITHPSARSLIEATRAKPSDDLVKMVLADWLEENGGPTLADRIRYAVTGTSRKVWDLKTGASMDSGQTLDEYQAQQAVYVLAARETLDATIEPGGLILTLGYDKVRGDAHVPFKDLTIRDCEDLVDEVVEKVLLVRSGRRSFTPSASACAFCPHKRFPKCKRAWKGIDESC